MTLHYNFDPEWLAWNEELKAFLPHSPDRRKAIGKIVETWMDLAKLSLKVQGEPAAENIGRRYIGLDPLKLSALKLAQSIEAHEVDVLSLYLQLTHKLILANIMQWRLSGESSQKPLFRFHFKPLDFARFPLERRALDTKEQGLWQQRERLRADIAVLRDEYEMYLFAESSHEAARSFGPQRPELGSQRRSWMAFSQLLCQVALNVHEENQSRLDKRSRGIEARRAALFHTCAQLLAKREILKESKKLHRQIRGILAQLNVLEDEIDSTLSELSIPSLSDYASLVVKKNPERATTCELTNIRPSTGDKT